MDRRRAGRQVAPAIGILLWWGGACVAPDAAVDPFAPRRLFGPGEFSAWSRSDYEGGSAAVLRNGVIHLAKGDPISGFRRHELGSLPTIDYEIELDAQRVEGIDFFLALTFPVGDDHCSLVLGGWGGQLSGLSSLDDFDASQNVTTQPVQFDNGRWYRVRLRVGVAHIRAWVDDQLLLEVGTSEYRLGIRHEMTESLPFGIACYDTDAAYRDMTIRRLRADEIDEN